VRLRKPHVDYTEVYPDNGDNNMLAVMKQLVAVKYKYMIFPEHARGLDVDSEFKTNNAAETFADSIRDDFELLGRLSNVPDLARMRKELGF